MLEFWKHFSGKHRHCLSANMREDMRKELNGKKDDAMGQSDIKCLFSAALVCAGWCIAVTDQTVLRSPSACSLQVKVLLCN